MSSIIQCFKIWWNFCKNYIFFDNRSIWKFFRIPHLKDSLITWLEKVTKSDVTCDTNAFSMKYFGVTFKNWNELFSCNYPKVIQDLKNKIWAKVPYIVKENSSVSSNIMDKTAAMELMFGIHIGWTIWNTRTVKRRRRILATQVQDNLP